MGFLERAIKDGISKGIGNAVGSAVNNAVGTAVNSAVKSVVEPKATAYANKVASELDEATKATEGLASETQKASTSATASTIGLGGAFANLQRSMETYATAASMNMKVCPSCNNPTTAEKTYCPVCGAKLPEQTLAQGAVCPKCGKQNTIGTMYCQDCGEKLPFAIEEEKKAAEKNASVLAEFETKLSNYPVWDLGGEDLSLESGDGYYTFTAYMKDSFEATNAVNQYREKLMQNGFKKAGQYPSIEHLYKMVGTACYHVDTEHCFEGDNNVPTIYFNISEPTGGYDYVKPEPKPQSGFGLKDLFKF